MPFDDVMPCHQVPGRMMSGIGSTTPTLYMIRGGEVVKDATGAWAIRVRIDVRGHSFDGIERAGGYVALQPGSYMMFMERSPNHGILIDKAGRAIKENGKFLGKDKLKDHKEASFLGRKQMRPQHNQSNDKGEHAAILIHPGATPANFKGCIGVGDRAPKGLSMSYERLEKVFELLGGFKEGRAVRLEVMGHNPGKTKPK
jgi:hypothetical protein